MQCSKLICRRDRARRDESEDEFDDEGSEEGIDEGKPKTVL